MLLPKKRTSPFTVRSRTTLPSRVTSWLRTVNFVAPLTVVAARRVSLPWLYFSTVVFNTSKFGASFAFRSPSRNTWTELLCPAQFLQKVLVNCDLEGIGEIKLSGINLVDLNAPLCRGRSAFRGFPRRALKGHDNCDRQDRDHPSDDWSDRWTDHRRTDH